MSKVNSVDAAVSVMLSRVGNIAIKDETNAGAARIYLLPTSGVSRIMWRFIHFALVVAYHRR